MLLLMKVIVLNLNSLKEMKLKVVVLHLVVCQVY